MVAERHGLKERPLCQRYSVAVYGLFYGAVNITPYRWLVGWFVNVMGWN